MEDLFKVSLGSLLLLTLTIAAEERKPSTEPTTVFVTPNYEPTTSATTKRTNISPLRFTFPPPRKDQQRSHSRQKIYEDTNPTQNIPATYESIVYNPASKEATSIFSSSNFWDTPELVIRETNQQKLGKNSIVTKSSRSEYTPNYRSIQTPLEKVQYQQASPVSEAEEEESQNSEETEETEELVEDPEEVEELVEEDARPTYPTNFQNQKFEPFESPDFYGDVLNNIGSIFSDEENKNTVNNLHPQFEEHSYENLRKEEDSDDNEELEEYDQVEDEETQTVTQPPVKPTPVQKPVLKQSPFPSVRILTNSSKPEKQRKQTFSPWLATAKPGKPALKFSPWLPTQQTVVKPVKVWPVVSTVKPVKVWPVVSSVKPVKVRPVVSKPVKKYSARRPKKSPNPRMDSPEMVFVTPVPSADQGGVETNIAQNIDELYSNQHKRV